LKDRIVGGRGKKQDSKNNNSTENRKMTERERGWNIKQQNEGRKDKNC
jgi:hypothetical protein